jgi:hypothetical protein
LEHVEYDLEHPKHMHQGASGTLSQSVQERKRERERTPTPWAKVQPPTQRPLPSNWPFYTSPASHEFRHPVQTKQVFCDLVIWEALTTGTGAASSRKSSRIGWEGPHHFNGAVNGVEEEEVLAYKLSLRVEPFNEEGISVVGRHGAQSVPPAPSSTSSWIRGARGWFNGSVENDAPKKSPREGLKEIISLFLKKGGIKF